MKRILLALSAALLVACVGEPGPNAPLQLTHNATTVVQDVRATTPAGRAVVAECFTGELRGYFAQQTRQSHYGSIVVGRYRDSGGCYWAWFAEMPNVNAAEETVLGICQNRNIEDCTVAANAVPDMNVALGAQTVSFSVSQSIANVYLNATGYSALAHSSDGFFGVATNMADQAAADQFALQRCQQDAAQGSGWNLNDPDRATRIFRQAPEACVIINRRAPDGSMTPRILQ